MAQRTFVYTTLSYDTDPQAVEDVLQNDKPELEKMILEQNEPFWLAVNGPEEVAAFEFSWKNVLIWMRAFKRSDTCDLEIKSQEYLDDCETIQHDFFKAAWIFRHDLPSPSIKDIFEHLEQKEIVLPEFPIELRQPEFSIEGMVDGVGQGLDENIKESVLLFNQIGLPTTMSCEGHLDHGVNVPWVDFPMTSLPDLLAMMKTLPEKFLEFQIMPMTEQFRLNAPTDWGLEKAQKEFAEFTQSIKASVPELQDHV